MQGTTISKATINALDLQFGVNAKASLWSQYTHFWDNVLHGNFSISISNGFEPVSSVIRGAAPWTLGLVGVSTVISFVLGNAAQLRALNGAPGYRVPPGGRLLFLPVA
jgi:peptide/nickel transport system permease protein